MREITESLSWRRTKTKECIAALVCPNCPECGDTEGMGLLICCWCGQGFHILYAEGEGSPQQGAELRCFDCYEGID